jgi:tetratricopeptide (TPR) repeat protein
MVLVALIVVAMAGWTVWGALHRDGLASSRAALSPQEASPEAPQPGQAGPSASSVALAATAATTDLPPESPPRPLRGDRSLPAAPADVRPTSVTASGQAAATPPDLMAQALYHHRSGDFERALVAYRTLIQQNELNARAHNNLGLLYQQKNLLDEAARAFERAIIIDARYGLAHSNYGVTLLHQGRPHAAAAQFRTVLELEPRNVDALVNLALAEHASGQAESARGTLLRAIGISPRHALAHYNLAVLHDDAGEPARALPHYRAFLEHAGADQADRTTAVRARVDALAKR